MNNLLLSPANDPMGTAVLDYYTHGKAAKLRVFSSLFEEDEIPVAQLFRSDKDLPSPEHIALELATGKILDVGAGSGCHTLALQEKGKEVCAIEISPLCVEVMKDRGVKDARLVNFFDPQFADKFDTILMLMNGSGIIGRIEKMPDFFRRIRLLLNPGGSVLMDSSDLRYLFEEEDGSFVIDLNDDYYGQVDFQMQYRQIKGDPFDWLYIDYDMLSLYAAQNGFQTELIKKGDHYDYLVQLTRK